MQSIYNYITNTLFNNLAAYRLDQDINDKFDKLEDQPEIGSRLTTSLDDISTEFHDFRKITVNNYLMLYEHSKESEITIITHIFHQTQNYGSLFQN